MYRSCGVQKTEYRGQKTERYSVNSKQETVNANGGIRDVEDLMVYRKAYATSIEIHRISIEFPRYEQHAVADQMRRASKSICANLAEGFGKQSVSKPEFKRFVLMAMGSADEMRVWIQYSLDLGYVDEAKARVWRNEYRNIAKMLAGLHSKWA